MSRNPYSVLIVEDDKIVRQALHTFLDHTDEFRVGGETDVNGLVARAAQLRPDVVLVDLNLLHPWPGVENGLTCLTELYAAVPTTRVVALIDADTDPDLVYRILSYGVFGCLLKHDSGLDEVQEALQKVVAGQSLLSDSALVSLVQSIRKQGAPHDGTSPEHLDSLTARECEVVDQITLGYLNREIANHLVISESTVHSHLHHILEKLQVKNRVQVAAFALRIGHPLHGRAA